MIADGGAKLHFVDDRFETVKAIAGNPHLAAMPKFQTYFATWCVAEICTRIERCLRIWRSLRRPWQGLCSQTAA